MFLHRSLNVRNFFITSIGVLLIFFLLPSVTHAATATLSASPSTVYTGGNITVTWSSTGAFKCIGAGFSTGGATSGSVTAFTTTSGVKTYSVTCYDESPACSLVLKSSYTDDFGVNTCNSKISYSPAGSCYPKNTACQTATPKGSNAYTINNYRCEGGCSTVTASDTVTVNDPPPPANPSVTLTTSPTMVTAGNSTLISWNAVSATVCDGTGFSTLGATSGSISVTPTGNTTYSITCDGDTFSSTPGTWEFAYTDYTDLWCPVEQINLDQTYSATPDCSPSNPTGSSCTGSQECKTNSIASCNVKSELYRCNGGVTPNQVSDSASVIYNQAPNKPTITGPTTGVAGTSYSFSFVATDPDSDQVRYQIDWDNDGSTVGSGDQITAYVNSGTSQNGSKSWVSPGNYTFQAYTRDINSAVSSPQWTTHSILISPAAAQCEDGDDNDGDGLIDLADFGCSGSTDDDESDNPQCSDGVDNDGDGLTDLADYGCTSGGDASESPNPQCSDGIDNNGNGKIDYPADPIACTSPTDNNEESLPPASLSLSANPQLSQNNAPISLVWSGTNIQGDLCSLTGTNGDSWNLSGTSGNQTSSALTEETIFTLLCTDLNDDPVATSITIKLVPQFGEI